MIDIKLWMERFTELLIDTFGERIFLLACKEVTEEVKQRKQVILMRW